MRGLVCATLMLSLLLGAIPLAGAESLSPPPLATATNTLFAHWNPDSSLYFMNTMDVDGDDANIGNGAGTGSVMLDITWSIPLSPTLDRDIGLDLTKDIVITAFIGGGSGAGAISVDTQLLAGSTVVADGAAQDLNQIPAGTQAPVFNNYQSVTWTVKPALDKLAAGTDLIWNVHASGSSTGTFLGMSADRGRSNLVLPITEVSASAAENILYETLTGAKVDLSKSYAEATTQTLHYNWTSELASPQVHFESTVKAGTVEVAILDGANKTAYQHNLAANGKDDATPKATAGKWQVSIVLKGFQGDFKVTIGPVPKAAGATSGAPTGAVTSVQKAPDKVSEDGASPEVVAPVGEDAKSSPAIGPILGFGLLGMALLARRRFA